MILSKHCKGCRCAVCRWQGTDNCLHDTNQPCSRCHGSGKVIDQYGNRACYRFIDASWACEGFAPRTRKVEAT